MNRELTHTLAAVVSLGLIGVGAYQAWPPLAPLVIGALMLSGIVYARTRREV